MALPRSPEVPSCYRALRCRHLLRERERDRCMTWEAATDNAAFVMPPDSRAAAKGKCPQSIRFAQCYRCSELRSHEPAHVTRSGAIWRPLSSRYEHTFMDWREFWITRLGPVSFSTSISSHISSRTSMPSRERAERTVMPTALANIRRPRLRSGSWQVTIGYPVLSVNILAKLDAREKT